MEVGPSRVCFGHSHDICADVLYAGQIVCVTFSGCGVREALHVLEENSDGGLCSNVNRMAV